jgi:hypothetical protein
MPKATAKDTTNITVTAGVKTVDLTTVRGNEDSRRPTPEHELTATEQVAVRTEPGAVTAMDDRFRRQFMVAYRDDYDDPQHADMHEANKLAVLSEALNAGLHPKEPAAFDGTQPTPQSGSILLNYSVAVVPAGLDADNKSTVAPRSLLLGMPGANSVVGDDGIPHR